MRKVLIAGNWKMNLTFNEGYDLISYISKEKLLKESTDMDVWFFPSFLYLQSYLSEFQTVNLKIGAQTVNDYEQGAYTGEVSIKMLQDIHCQNVIIGHSERRQYYNESNESCNRKLKLAQKYAIHPIYCIGETLAEYERKQTLDVLSRQLQEGLDSINDIDFTIAYEPIWAIGTGKTPTMQDIQDTHHYIRKELAALLTLDVAKQTRILYGGSVSPDNSKELKDLADVDGVLVGGASLNKQKFVDIIINLSRSNI